jgi:hypothetical protein
VALFRRLDGSGNWHWRCNEIRKIIGLVVVVALSVGLNLSIGGGEGWERRYHRCPTEPCNCGAASAYCGEAYQACDFCMGTISAKACVRDYEETCTEDVNAAPCGEKYSGYCTESHSCSDGTEQMLDPYGNPIPCTFNQCYDD